MYPLFTGINIKSSVSQKTNQCHIKIFGQAHRQAGWSSHCTDNLYSRHRCFLYQLKAGTAT